MKQYLPTTRARTEHYTYELSKTSINSPRRRFVSFLASVRRLSAAWTPCSISCIARFSAIRLSSVSTSSSMDNLNLFKSLTPWLKKTRILNQEKTDLSGKTTLLLPYFPLLLDESVGLSTDSFRCNGSQVQKMIPEDILITFNCVVHLAWLREGKHGDPHGSRRELSSSVILDAIGEGPLLMGEPNWPEI